MIPGVSDPAGCGCWSCFQIHFPEQLVTRESPSNHVGAETEVITHNEFRMDQMNIKGWVGCRSVYMQHCKVLIVFCGDKFPTKYVLSFTLFLTLFNLLITFGHLDNIKLIHKRTFFSSISPHVVFVALFTFGPTQSSMLPIYSYLHDIQLSGKVKWRSIKVFQALAV